MPCLNVEHFRYHITINYDQILKCNSYLKSGISINAINDASKLGHQSDQSLWILESSRPFLCNSHQKLFSNCLAVCAICDVFSSRRCLSSGCRCSSRHWLFFKGGERRGLQIFYRGIPLFRDIFGSQMLSLCLSRSNWTYFLAGAVGRVSWAALVSLCVSAWGAHISRNDDFMSEGLCPGGCGHAPSRKASHHRPLKRVLRQGPRPDLQLYRPNLSPDGTSR